MRLLRDTLGWGVVIYSIMYLLWSGLVLYGVSQGYVSLAVRILALVFLTAMASKSLRRSSWFDLAPFALSWAASAIVLDAIFLVPLAGWALYSSWSVWVGYALIAAAPLLLTSISLRRMRPAMIP